MLNLTERQRQIFELTCKEGYGVGEVALAMGISPQTVKNHMYTVRKMNGGIATYTMCYLLGRESTGKDKERGNEDE